MRIVYSIFCIKATNRTYSNKESEGRGNKGQKRKCKIPEPGTPNIHFEDN